MLSGITTDEVSVGAFGKTDPTTKAEIRCVVDVDARGRLFWLAAS